MCSLFPKTSWELGVIGSARPNAVPHAHARGTASHSSVYHVQDHTALHPEAWWIFNMSSFSSMEKTFLTPKHWATLNFHLLQNQVDLMTLTNQTAWPSDIFS